MLSLVPEITPPGARGFAVALYAFSMTMIGSSLGPIAVASLTERVFGDPQAVGSSMAIVGCVALAASSLLAMRTARVLQGAGRSGRDDGGRHTEGDAESASGRQGQATVFSSSAASS
jgi:MFS family permease